MPDINKTFVDKTTDAGEYRDNKLLGFVLDVGKSGVQTYKVNGRIKGGSTITYTIGRHGEHWNATTARKKALDILHEMKNGQDPRATLKQKQAANKALLAKNAAHEQRNKLTVRKVFEDWCAEARNKQSAKTLYRQVIFKHLDEWLDVPMADIDDDMVCKRYDEVAKGTVSSANNAFRGLRFLYGWAINRYKTNKKPTLEDNPVLALGKQKKWIEVASRKNEIIADADLKAWFDAVMSLQNEDFRDYFVLLLLTGLRKSEAAGLRWSTNGKVDVDFKQSRLTVRNTKNKTDHTIPMTPYITELLQRREKKYKKQSDFVFPGNGTTGHIKDISHPQKQIIEKSKVEFKLHDLRRTFSYAAERSGIGVTQQKKLLNHLQKGDITHSAYTVTSHKSVDDLLEPLQQVEDYLLDLARSGKKAVVKKGKSRKKA